MKVLDLEAAPDVTLSLIDLPLGMEGYHHFFGVWLVRDEAGGRNVIVDPGPASSVPLLLETLGGMGVDRLDLVLLTHIHLDHSGGLAELLEAFPAAMVAVHPRGKPHLADPARLWESSLRVIPEMAPAYGEPAPVDEGRFIPEGAPIPGILAVDTPGHAPHHRSFFYETPAGPVLFAGEAAGTFTRLDTVVPGADEGKYVLRPASPPRFYIDQALQSIETLKAVNAILLCYAHFGYSKEVSRMLDEAARQIQLWRVLFAEFLEGKGRPGADQVDMDGLLSFLLSRDPWLEAFPMLPSDVRSREMNFMLSSASGFLETVTA